MSDLDEQLIADHDAEVEPYLGYRYIYMRCGTWPITVENECFIAPRGKGSYKDIDNEELIKKRNQKMHA